METELESFLSTCMDGELTQLDADRLESLLRSNLEFRAEFVAMMRQDRVLRVLRGDKKEDPLLQKVMDHVNALQGGEEFINRIQSEIKTRKMRTGAPKAAASSPSTRFRGRKRAASSNHWNWVFATAAAMTFLTLGLYLSNIGNARNAEVLAVVSEASGRELTLKGPAGVRILQVGTALSNGDTIRTGNEGRIRIKYPDETSMVLASASALTLDQLNAAAAKQVRLESGFVSAEVRPQPANAPMTLLTGDARITVQGTELAVALTPTGTRLEVQKGKVKLQRIADGAQIQVDAGNFAIAGRDTSVAMAVLSMTALAVKEGSFNAIPKGQNGSPRGYWEFLPSTYNTDTAREYPIVIFFNGIEEGGDGSAAELGRMLKWGPPQILSDATHPLHNLFEERQVIVLCPQGNAPPDWWHYVHVAPFLAHVFKNYRIDHRRIYLTGIFAGSLGINETMDADPKLATQAAAILLADAQGAPGSIMAPFEGPSVGAKVPYWAVTNLENTHEPAIGVDRMAGKIAGTPPTDVLATIPAAAPLRTATFSPAGGWTWSTGISTPSGANPILTVVQGSHQETFVLTYNKLECWNWLFAQRKPVEK